MLFHILFQSCMMFFLLWMVFLRNVSVLLLLFVDPHFLNQTIYYQCPAVKKSFQYHFHHNSCYVLLYNILWRAWQWLKLYLKHFWKQKWAWAYFIVRSVCIPIKTKLLLLFIYLQFDKITTWLVIMHNKKQIQKSNTLFTLWYLPRCFFKHNISHLISLH